MSLSAVTEETASLREFLYGQTENCLYDNWISHVAEGIARPNYNLYAPWEEQTDGFGNFHIPDALELEQWSMLYETYLNGELDNAQALIDSFGFPYEAVDFTDSDTGRNYWILRENVDYEYFDDNGTIMTEDDEIGAFAYGWGFYLYNPLAQNPIIISAPHPNDDYITVPLAVECLQQWDAMFLFISGAGREVEWTEAGLYNNGKSISDPTRNEEHPLIRGCRQATDLIRENYRREFSAQIHSYDWNRHAGHANCQISVVHNNPNLPVRDLSPLHNDMINAADLLMVPSGSFGEHDDAFLNDYYAVYYNKYPFQYVNEDTTITINNSVDLTGVGGAFLTYATEEWNSYDVYDPFFHMEMDELPNEFEQLTTELQNFYAYDPQSGVWDFQQRYDKALGWYNRWVDDLWQVLPATLEMDDTLVPAAVDSIWFTDFDESSVRVNWIPQPAYDHYTYRVYIDTTEINPEFSSFYSREDNYLLASPLHDYSYLDTPLLNQQYFCQIAVEDYNDNITYSQQFSLLTAPAIVEDFAEFGGDGLVELHWNTPFQSGCVGFNVYRRTGNASYEYLAGWEDSIELQSNGSSSQDYSYTDFSVDNYYIYSYKISMVNEQGDEYYFGTEVLANPRPVYSLVFNSEEAADTVDFSWNYYASDGYDTYYDFPQNGYQGEQLYCSFFQPYWDDHYLGREIKGYYNPASAWKSWNIRIYSQLTSQDVISVQSGENFPVEYYYLYLLNTDTEEMYNLSDQEDDYITPAENGSAHLVLYAGDLQPEIEILTAQNRIYVPGEEVIISYDRTFPQLIDHYSLKLCSVSECLTILDSVSAPLPAETVWTVPDSLTISGAQPKLYYTSCSGVEKTASGDYNIGLLTDEVTYDMAAGWYNFSNVWQNSPFDVEGTFGENSTAYSYNDGTYCSEDTIFFGRGYWLETTEDVVLTGSGDYQLTEWSHILNSGWNLLSNPFPCEISVNGLEFEILNSRQDYHYMVEHGNISRNIYVYRDTLFVPVESVASGESFYLYNLSDGIFPLTLYTEPYAAGIPLPEIEANFLLGMHLSQLTDDDCCWLGNSANSSNGFDEIYDFPALPAKPDSAGCRLVLNNFTPGFPTTQFHTLFTGSFWNEPVKETAFSATGIPEQEMMLSFDESELPLDYFVWVEINDDLYDLDLIDNIILTESSSGSVFVQYPRIWNYGDVDKSDGIEAFDAALVLQYSVGINPITAPLPWQEWRLITADVDGNENVGSYDAALILQYCIDIIEEFPVESRLPFSAPEGEVSLRLNGDELQIFSEGNVHSLSLNLAALVNEFHPSTGLLWAQNQEENYQLSIASAGEIKKGELIGSLYIGKYIEKLESLQVVINGIEKQVDIKYNEIPAVTSLLPVYPNPFYFDKYRSHHMKVRFSLAQPCDVNISVYNIRGQKVKNIASGLYPEGENELAWDLSSNGKKVSSGVYFIKMSADDYMQRRKFIIIK